VLRRYAVYPLPALTDIGPAAAINRISKGHFTASSELRNVPFLAPSVCGYLFVYISEPLNGFPPNSHGGRVGSLARTSVKVKVKGQGHHAHKTAFSALSVACVLFMFGKTFLASSFLLTS